MIPRPTPGPNLLGAPDRRAPSPGILLLEGKKREVVVSGFINLRGRLLCGPEAWGLLLGTGKRFIKDRGMVNRGAPERGPGQE